MCGIIAIVRQRSRREAPSSAEVLALLEGVPGLLATAIAEASGTADSSGLAMAVSGVAERVSAADLLLRGVPGVRALLADRALPATLDGLCGEGVARVADIEQLIDRDGGSWKAGTIEAVNAALIELRDALWALQRDRLRAARAVGDLAGHDAGPAAIEAFMSVQQALSGIDRLEVRGRDSAGVHLLVRDHGLDLRAASIAALLEGRVHDPLFSSSSVRVGKGDVLSFVYKAAAEIGELGDNTTAMRATIRNDALLHRVLASPTAQAVVLGHTRWASVGIISQPNAHPLNSDETDRTDGPYVVGALNGDIDNFADLKAAESLHLATDITTDAKVIPTLVSRRLAGGDGLVEAFRRSASVFEGSVAIGVATAEAPDRLALALRGSGQALYVGLAEDAFVVASEPYGLVEETLDYVRLDGETPANPANPTASRGQIMVLTTEGAGSVAGIERLAYDGTALPVSADDVVTAEITTRDIDRRHFAHFLLKEISEAPSSFRKTLRGKLVERDGQVRVSLGPDTLPDALRARLRDGHISRVLVIGQGTASVAGSSLARALLEALEGIDLRVESLAATELSGFHLRADMSNTLVVAISQSGTTTDTNRTVDLVRSRGASVVAVVNRRNSDLTDKADGVLYTSDGRDVEMSVASTKAFYSQVAAGFLLAHAIADEVLADPRYQHSDAAGAAAARGRSDLLAALRDIPNALEATMERRPAIAAAAQQLAPSKRYWAVVGSGADKVAAQEIRIKLSELCYKSIACDTTEDKKHIDLSAEPLILVCATGLFGSNADDVAKEVAIYRAHKATPIVIATEGEERYTAALQALTVPATHPRLGFILAAMVGHLFGYEAALAIDAQAALLREARASIEQLAAAHVDADELMVELVPLFEPIMHRWFNGLRSGVYDGHLEASTATRITSMLRYAAGISSLELYQVEYGRQGSPSVLVEDLVTALTAGIDELTRPIDAIKHQAKTVTVGISRSDEGVSQVPLVRSVFEAGAARDRLSYRTLRTVAELDPAIAEVIGFTRYRIEGRIETGDATIVVVDRGGISRDLPLRTEANPLLRGTKHRVAFEREVTVAVGRSDGRPVVIVPEVKGNQCSGITLLHVRFEERLPAPVMRGVLEGYRSRYAALRDAVTETEPTFRDDLLADLPVVDVLTAPVLVLASRWKST